MRATPWPTITGGTSAPMSAGEPGGGSDAGFVAGVVPDPNAAFAVEAITVGAILQYPAGGPAIEAITVGAILQFPAGGPSVEAITVAAILQTT